MRDEPQDSFELFADTLTITLGCIIFIALLLVTITRSHQMDKSGLFHFERRSELLSRQLEIAETEVIKTKLNLDSITNQDGLAEQRLREHQDATTRTLLRFLDQNEEQYASALLSENIRSQLFLRKLPWMLQTIKSNISSLNDRIERAFSEAAEAPISASILREQNIDAPVPVYVVIFQNNVYPVPGGPGREYRHIQWRATDLTRASNNNRTWQLSVKEDAGLDLSRGLQQLKETAAGMPRESKSQFVLLVYADSFETARSVLKALSTWEVNFSWRPLEEGQRILMREGGLPPESPL